MQDAYMQEKGQVGDWVLIGYSAPGSRVSNNTSSYESNVFTYYSTGANWTAKPKSDLNDCKASVNGDLWSLTASVNSGSLVISDNNTSTNCKALTASWDNLFRAAPSGS